METTSTRPRRALAVAAAGAVTLASALAFAGPVQADESYRQDGCKVTLMTPAFWKTSSTGDDLYQYAFQATCFGKRTLYYEHKVYQLRDGRNHVRQERTGQWTFSQGENQQATKKRVPWNTLKDYNKSGRESVHHAIRFKVEGFNNIDGEWSPWFHTDPISVNG
ncbi:hypothetical protein [Micrococcus sp. TA1]|uniref:hypothetical protein n=1 Tax=Micrococcus sp. TA1 TaxID=681627 RepID=UPI00160CD726|nr:hypothetical protein [Micrococcus sp. TA1]MBB5747941.1 hypothetical protein [Micrococcus sp. TA1]